MSGPSGDQRLSSVERLLVESMAPFPGGLALALVGALGRLLAVDKAIVWLHLGTRVGVLGLAVTCVGIIALGISLGLRDSSRRGVLSGRPTPAAPRRSR